MTGSCNKKYSHLSPELWFTQTLLEFYLLVALDQTYPKGRRDKVLRLPFHTLYHVLSGDDGLNVLGDSGIGSCIGTVRDRKLKWAKKKKKPNQCRSYPSSSPNRLP